MPTQPTIHILLATHNGERYLEQQLESIARQTYASWTLTVSDDDSTDNTLLIVERFAKQVHQPIVVLRGPNQGTSTANFCHLIAQARNDNSEDLYAFCDQDDVWYEDKLLRAVNWHVRYHDHAVRLYCGRTQFVNKELKPIGLSPNIKYPPSFGNALVQNIASGNTMVFNHAVLQSQKIVLPEQSIWHDWTTYIVATALGGLVWFDDQPCLFYRQHDANVIGSNDDLKAQLVRLKPLFLGRFKHWADVNCSAISELQDSVCHKSVNTFKNFQAIRSAPSAITRVLAFVKSDIRRQRTSSNALLTLAFMMKLI